MKARVFGRGIEAIGGPAQRSSFQELASFDGAATRSPRSNEMMISMAKGYIAIHSWKQE
jgi:hypothetical protein